MKKILFCLLVCFSFSSSTLFAQLAMKLELNRRNYLRYENIFVKVTLRNLSGHPLVFGDNPNLRGQLRFDVVMPSGKKARLIVQNYSPLLGKVIPPGKTESLIIPLSKMYDIMSPGKYKVKAVVEHSQLPDAYQSDYMYFKVVNGDKVWDATVGVPTTGELKDGKKIESRRYEVQSFFDGINHVYCLIVEDNKYVYGVARLGYDIGNLKPECEIDRFSKIHILLQSSPEIYSYYVYDTDCHLDEKGVYKKSKTTPRLVRDPDSGKIFVIGGTKARKGADYVETTQEMR